MARGNYKKSSRDRRRDKEEAKPWIPRTQLGKRVYAGEIKSLDEILESGAKVLEPEIVDFLLPDLTEEVIEVTSTQRMTACGRKMFMRAIVILGDKNGHIALGLGKAPETRDAIAEAMMDAKKNIVRVRLGCGSWECGCGAGHSVALQVTGKSANTVVTIRPAPRGVGIVAGATSRKVLELAGVKDAWTMALGRTRNALNVVSATIDALNSLNKQKKGKIVAE
ncbi:MAG: 30S ribosomal protein S5 [Candidatus Micrarchaeia archaeon]